VEGQLAGRHGVLGEGVVEQGLEQAGALGIGDAPADDPAAEDIENDVEIEVAPFRRSCQLCYWRNSTWLLIRKGSTTYCYTIFNSILALRVLICPNEVSFAPLEGILAGRRRASARRACVTGARRV